MDPSGEMEIFISSFMTILGQSYTKIWAMNDSYYTHSARFGTMDLFSRRQIFAIIRVNLAAL